MEIYHSIRKLLTLLVTFSILFSLGIYPVSALASLLVDTGDHFVLAIEHGDLHLRFEGDHHDHGVKTNNDTHGHDHVNVNTRTGILPLSVDHPYGDAGHGTHLPSYEQQRIVSPASIHAPVLVTPLRLAHLLHRLASTNDSPIIPVAPGIEHNPPPTLQRTVILLI